MHALVEKFVSPYMWKDRLRRWHERAQGVDFSGVVWPEQVGLDPNRAIRHCNSGSRWLRRLLQDLPITHADSILDVGCGKGGAMKIMLEFSFARVDGIEAAEAIARVARANFATLKIPADRWRVITADATEFAGLDDYNYIYMYNPFTCEVMAEFIENVRASLERKPRLLTFIYNNPICHDTVLASGLFRALPRFYRDDTGAPCRIYTNRYEEAVPTRA